MRCPTLSELPPPPLDRIGWPWTEEGPQLKDVMPNDAPWPRVSLVTPSYNQGQFVEETIRSILLQGYPNLEYIIIDGGSSDNSVEVIRKYEPWITYWVSERDRGQSQAISKGFSQTSGTIMGWLNSDDMLAPQALSAIAQAFSDSGCDILSGHALRVDDRTQPLREFHAEPCTVSRLLKELRSCVPQMSTFWGKAVWEECGPLAEDLRYTMDYDYFLRVAAMGWRWVVLDATLSFCRSHLAAKTYDMSRNNIERRKVLQRFAVGPCNKPEFAADLRRALWNEGWFEYWQARYRLSSRRIPYFIYWLLGPLQNWRLLGLRQFYPRALWTLGARMKRHLRVD